MIKKIWFLLPLLLSSCGPTPAQIEQARQQQIAKAQYEQGLTDQFIKQTQECLKQSASKLRTPKYDICMMNNPFTREYMVHSGIPGDLWDTYSKRVDLYAHKAIAQKIHGEDYRIAINELENDLRSAMAQRNAAVYQMIQQERLISAQENAASSAAFNNVLQQQQLQQMQAPRHCNTTYGLYGAQTSCY